MPRASSALCHKKSATLRRLDGCKGVAKYLARVIKLHVERDYSQPGKFKSRRAVHFIDRKGTLRRAWRPSMMVFARTPNFQESSANSVCLLQL